MSTLRVSQKKSNHADMISPPSPTKKPVSLMDDFPDLILLIVMYLLQGIPLGLAFGSVPFILRSRNSSYSDLAVFSLASYPYSLKLFWSPIVDAIYFKSIGRRKSWIVPIQAVISITLFLIGSRIDPMLQQDVLPVKTLAIAFFFLVFLCATQDIAVDGWALTLLREENKAYASTAQTIGMNSGYFLSFTVFLALNSPEFCNKYLRSTPLSVGLFELGSYIQFWALAFVACDLWLILVKKEKLSHEPSGWHEIRVVYRQIWSICTLPQMQKFIAIMLIAKLGFIASESVTGLKLLEKGFKKEDLALAVLIDFPFEIVFGYYAAKWSSGASPLKPWLYAFYGRLVSALLGMVLVASYPSGGVTTTYFIVIMASTVLSSFMSTVQFVGMGSFFTRISDPSIGGTYMTLLNTVSNFGGTWPRYFILNAVDHFTSSTCTKMDVAANTTIQCADDASKALCKSLEGTCNTYIDGYYVTLYIEALNERTWKVVKPKAEDDYDGNLNGSGRFREGEEIRLINQ
ncbi:hypothetical protein SeMB42_g07298 [Synchytrium endobioticum]|uniref:Acetyl-coenzyme A transporter 1 n=1 Tax=Synchytrium endobioticum TaxID=286115 RepID=A0A507CAQ9_9FUNG|nr:hypothetical protein SeMB42_g07298 [Synchytrium endobioticum]TPX46614.1 hypothetical protein SeLEV6574_g03141 [Synchytrium endobioticum]